MTNRQNNIPRAIENRKARHQYSIEDTLEVGIVLKGTEVKSARHGQVSLAEGWIKASTNPLRLTLYSVHIAEYQNASPAHQHSLQRSRQLLAHKREIRKLETFAQQKGRTLIPLKMYFTNNKIKLLVGMAAGKHKTDKRQDLAKKTAKRDIDRAMKRRL